jgi:hypothetical protein
MKTLLVTALLAATAAARPAAAAPEVAATAALTGPDPSVLFDQQVAATAAPEQVPCVSGGGCASRVVRSARFGRGGRVEVRHAVIFGGASIGDFGPLYQVLIRWHQRWIVAGILPLEDESCGAGSCVEQEITGLRVKLAGDRVWVTVRRRTVRSKNSCDDCVASAATADDVLACRLGDTPTCAVVPAAWDEEVRARVAGEAVVQTRRVATSGHALDLAPPSPMRAGADPDAVFDATMTAFYRAGPPPCGGTGSPCGSTVTAEHRLGKVVVQLREAKTSDGARYQVLIGFGHRWYATGGVNTCDDPTCVDRLLTRPWAAGRVVGWTAAGVDSCTTSACSLSHPADRVYTCQLDARPRCVQIAATEGSRARWAGDTVVLTRRVDVHF